MEQIFTVLKNYPSGSYMTNEMIDFIREHLDVVVFNKEEILDATDGIADHFYFVERGLVREIYFKKKKAMTMSFKKENEFIMASNPFVIDRSQPKDTVSMIEALENSVLWSFPTRALERIYKLYPQFDVIHIDIIMKASIIDKNHFRIIRLDSAREKYGFVSKRFPELLRRIEPKYLASYMDIPVADFNELHSEHTQKQSN